MKLWIDADAAPRDVKEICYRVRMGGVDTGGHATYGAKEKQAFANAIDRALTRALRNRT